MEHLMMLSFFYKHILVKINLVKQMTTPHIYIFINLETKKISKNKTHIYTIKTNISNIYGHVYQIL